MNVLSFLGLAKEERRNAMLLIGSNFFEGLSIALFYSVALAYFLDHNPISNYGWLMVASGVFVILFALIYRRIEHVLELSKLFGFLVMLTVLVFVGGYIITGYKTGLSAAGTGFVLMMLHHFIYVLYKIRFWGLTALFYDVRQSKRVFGLIGSMNLPAKFIGFTLVTTLEILTNVGYENLLLLGVGTYFCSAAFMYFIIRENPAALHLDHDHNKHQGEHSGSIIKGILSLGMVMMFTMTFIGFLFAKEVQHHFELTDGNMFRLISLALALSYGLATIVKIVASGKLLSRFKLSALLVFTPLMLSIAILFHLVIRTTYQVQDQEYLFFVMLMMGSLILTEAIDNPLVMSLFQPLSKRKILEGHTLVKGFGESVSVVLVGLLLIFFYRGHHHVNLAVAIPIVLLSSILWWWAANRFSGNYLFHLRHLIELKLISGNQVMLFNQDTDKS